MTSPYFETSHLSLNHVAPVFSHLENESKYIDVARQAILLQQLEHLINSDERPRATNTGTEVQKLRSSAMGHVQKS